MTCYEILGVNHGATRNEINAAFHSKAKHCHPDNGGDAGSFRRLVAAKNAAIAALEFAEFTSEQFWGAPHEHADAWQYESGVMQLNMESKPEPEPINVAETVSAEVHREPNIWLRATMLLAMFAAYVYFLVVSQHQSVISSNLYMVECHWQGRHGPYLLQRIIYNRESHETICALQSDSQASGDRRE